MVNNYFKIAWRNLLKNKLFTGVNIFGLALGLASCMLICLYIYDQYSYDKHHTDVDQLYQVATIFKNPDGDNKTAATPYGVANVIKDEFPEIEEVTRLVGLFVDSKTLIKYKNEEESKLFYETNGYLTDRSFFNFFKYTFLEGKPENALMAPKSIVISSEIADKIFGNKTALGETLTIESNTNGNADFKVTGVFDSKGLPSHIDARFFMSFEGGALNDYVKSQTSMAGNNLFFTYIKLKKGANASALQNKLPGFVEKYMGADLKKAGFGKEQFLLPVKNIHLSSEIPENVTTSANAKSLFILFSIALFILLIATINYMNLSTARSSKRSAEVGVRKVLGAQKSSLVYQFLSESILLSFIAFTIALGVVVIFIPAFRELSGAGLSFTITQYGWLFSGFFVISLITGALAGSYPAFYLSSFQPIKVLKGKLTNSFAAVSLRKSLVVLQFTIAIILMVASVVIFNQMNFLGSTGLGFERNQQIIIPLRSQSTKASYTNLKTEIVNLTQVESVGASAYYPGIFNPEDAKFYKEGQNMDLAKHTFTNRVDYDFLKTLKITLLAGREFHPGFVDSTSVILNEKAISEMGFASPEDAIGQRIFTDRGNEQHSLDIIGVVKDFHFKDLKSAISPYAFTLNDRINYNYLIAHISSKDVNAAILSIIKLWNKSNPDEPFEYSFLDADFQKNYVAESKLYTIVGYFTIIAILISCLGLFGLVTFNAELRTKEIGVRKVLGASVQHIVLLMSKDFMKLVVIAIVIAIPIGWWAMEKWLQEFAYKIELGWWMFGLSAVIAITIALLTLSTQAIRAAIANPVNSLRTE